jgi:murein DD-endopeptidase MepM/ murein hydrolase activator NlpD
MEVMMPEQIYVKNDDPLLFSVQVEDGGDATKHAQIESEWKRFTRADPATNTNYTFWYRPTKRGQSVKVDRLMPPDSPMGRYRVEVFVPGRHATTRKAIFSVANNFRTVDNVPQYDETTAMVDMYDLYDVWASLGEFILDPGSNPMSGRVRQYDMSLEDPPAEITFGPVRWVPIPKGGETPRFDMPMGTQVERDAPITLGIVATGWGPLWIGKWYDATPYCTWYTLGYHTGADLNIQGTSDADKDAPIFATGDGKVIYAGEAGSWGNIIVIEHPDALVHRPDGSSGRQKVYSRYGHVTDRILVKVGDQVTRGQNIGFIGLMAGATTGWHLHFDIGYSSKLGILPRHWPDMSKVRELQKTGVKPTDPRFRDAQAAVKQEVLSNYVNPQIFLKDNHG